jgi:hypothetical protein
VDMNTGDSIDCPPDLIVDMVNRDLEPRYLDRLGVIELERQILNGKHIS